MEIRIKEALDEHRENFIEFAIKLSKFNRNYHSIECLYDDDEPVFNAISENAKATFENRNENILILIAEIDKEPVGYALARIYEEEQTADNGRGRIGLLDQLYVEENARGFGVGKRLVGQVINWMKEKGIHRIKLRTYSWNGRAQKFYQECGFKEYLVSYEKYI